jgi:tRNA dimethylallyltransferase
VSAADERVRLLRDRFAESSKLLCIVGPTASGKTDLAMELCEAMSGEIVSADSVQIYRGFDIGSGKPTPSERARAPHHLVDTHEPGDTVDAAAWARLAEEAIADIRARGKVPIVCGGTFFWVRALVLGLVDAPPADEAVRERHRALASERGRAALHEALARVDPESARRLHPNDVVRVSRALEVYEVGGRTMTELQSSHGFRDRRHDAAFVGLKHDAAVLAERIRARVERWLAGGFIEEVEALVRAGHGSARAMSSVGYAEVHAHVEGKLAREDLATAIVRSTRTFARRQRTWLNHADVEWL